MYCYTIAVADIRKQTMITLESEGETNGRLYVKDNSKENSGEKDTSTYSHFS